MVCTTLHVFFFCLFSFVVCFVDETPSMCPESISAGEFYTFWSGFDYSRVMALLLIIWCLCPKEPFFWGISRPSFNLRGLSFHCFGPSHGNEAGVETKKQKWKKYREKKCLRSAVANFLLTNIKSVMMFSLVIPDQCWVGLKVIINRRKEIWKSWAPGVQGSVDSVYERGSNRKSWLPF